MVTSSPANASEDWAWNAEMGGLTNTVNQGVDIRQIPLFARLKNLSFRIPNSNPDTLIYGIRFSEKFDQSPLAASKKLNIGFWLWNSNGGCIDEGSCEQVLIANAPAQWAGKYPSEPSSNTVKVYRVNQVLGKSASESDFADAGCPAPWWIDSKSNYGVIYFQLSISCLKIPATFYSYAFAGADTGIRPIPYNFIEKTLAINPVWQLAQNNYDSRGGREGLLKNLSTLSQELSESNSKIEGDNLDFQKRSKKKFRLTCSDGIKIKKILKNNSKCPTGLTLIKKIRL